MTFNKNYALGGTQLWPTMLFTRIWEQHEAESPGILGYLASLQQQQQQQIDSGIAIGAKSGQGLYESGFDLFKEPDSSLQKLVKFIESSLCVAVSVANDQKASPQDLHVEFVDSWYHITNNGGYHDAHVHHGCSWCGIYYLEIGSSGQRVNNGAPNGGSRFYSPLGLGGSYRDYGNKYLASSIDPPMENGQLILFPSYLLHSGLPYTGEKDRVVIAFNARVHITAGSPSALRLGLEGATLGQSKK